MSLLLKHFNGLLTSMKPSPLSIDICLLLWPHLFHRSHTDVSFSIKHIKDYFPDLSRIASFSSFSYQFTFQAIREAFPDYPKRKKISSPMQPVSKVPAVSFCLSILNVCLSQVTALLPASISAFQAGRRKRKTNFSRNVQHTFTCVALAKSNCP